MKIYLACPYSHRKKQIMADRFELANKKTAELMKQGHIVFSPISHSHSIAVQEKLPLDFEFWKKMDTSFIEWCDAVYVLKIDGWEKSKGVKKEISIAMKLNKKIEEC